MVILFGGALIVATDFQIGKMKRRQGGTESATAVLGVGYFLGGVLWLIAQAGSGGDENAFINVALVLAGLVLGAAAWRWGYWIFAVAAMVAVFVLLARMPLGRLLWIVLPLILAPFLLRAGESAARPPAHRRAADALLAVSLVFLYLAVHLGSWDEKILEQLRGGSPDLTPIALLRFASALATAAVPVIVLLVGVFRRRRLLINLGLVGILASVITLRFYVHVMPHWAALLLGRRGGGGRGPPHHALSGFRRRPGAEWPHRRAALRRRRAAKRPRDRSRGGERNPAARQTGSPGFEGGGGRSGGGGATETI
jgi:uncharacterized membrane protein YgcG